MAIRHYVLLATDGFIHLPNTPETGTNNRTAIYVYSFIGGLYHVIDDGYYLYENPILNWQDPSNWQDLYQLKGTGTLPAPIIWGEVGDNIYITLINLGKLHRPDLSDHHSIDMHGGHLAAPLEGFPGTFFSVPVWKDPNTPPPSATYNLMPQKPGSYMYHCPVDTSSHIQMGMYGACIIYPSKSSLWDAGIAKDSEGHWCHNGIKCYDIPKNATHKNFAYNDIHTYFDREHVMLLSEVDSNWHQAMKENCSHFNAVNFKPNYWLINGRSFPDTLEMHPLTPSTESNPNLTQINYESYIQVKIHNKCLFRMINMGNQAVPWHIHGWHFQVIGKDAHPSPWLKISAQLNQLDRKHSKYDLRLDNTTLDMATTATIGSGETYDLLLTAEGKTEEESSFFPQFYPAHNHNGYKMTNNGVYPGGQLTYMQVDAPDKESLNP